MEDLSFEPLTSELSSLSSLVLVVGSEWCVEEKRSEHLIKEKWYKISLPSSDRSEAKIPEASHFSYENISLSSYIMTLKMTLTQLGLKTKLVEGNKTKL